MPGDATPPPELPPGLLAEYLESARSQLAALSGLAELLSAARGGPAAAGVPTPPFAVAPEAGGALVERASRRRVGRRPRRAGGDLRRGRRGARRAARVRAARARISVPGVS